MVEGVDGLLRDKTRPSGIPPMPNGKVVEFVRLTQKPPPARRLPLARRPADRHEPLH